MIAPPRPPSHHELELLIKEARQRRLRRRLLGAAAVAIAAALGLAVYAITLGDESSATNSASTKPVGVPLCRSGQLAGSAGFQGATGTLLGSVTLQNTSSVACSLPQGRPLVTVSWRGKVLPTQERNMLTGPPWPPAHALAPERRASVYWQWFSCGGQGAPRVAVRPTFTLRFGHNLLVTAHTRDMTPPFCSGLGGRRFLGVTHALVYR
ncbi:MAG TPA: DUF4232 domain-containing protein [Gaiellaceae bacterium]|nr:DUF4232 domain-containing protein [Gaiellaceae bacterium]